MFSKLTKKFFFVVLLALTFTASTSAEAQANYRHRNGQYYPSTGERIAFKVIVWSIILGGGAVSGSSK